MTRGGSVLDVVNLDLGTALREAQAAPESIPDIMMRVAKPLGATDLAVYLVDFAQTSLQPMPDCAPHAAVSIPEEVIGTMAGRAFITGCVVTTARPGGVRVWAPITEGSDRTGVIALTVDDWNDTLDNACIELGLLAGYLIATQARTTDLYNLHRRRRALSLAASMQWDLLPPLILKTPTVTVAGMLEPAYDVGGDYFDYALNNGILNIAIVDVMGHGVASAMISALVAGSYRHDRREGQPLDKIHAHLDDVVERHWPKLAFATGQLAQLDITSGELTWTNAGHPLPLLVRGGRVVGELQCRPTVPWGISSITETAADVMVANEMLEPGDGVLFYTDGVIEAHEPGEEMFGTERLEDLANRHASDQLEPEEIVRLIVRSVLEYRIDALDDDATLLLVRWSGPTPV